jgi:hypothetical protein
MKGSEIFKSGPTRLRSRQPRSWLPFVMYRLILLPVEPISRQPAHPTSRFVREPDAGNRHGSLRREPCLPRRPMPRAMRLQTKARTTATRLFSPQGTPFSNRSGRLKAKRAALRSGSPTALAPSSRICHISTGGPYAKRAAIVILPHPSHCRPSPPSDVGALRRRRRD